MAKFNIGDKVVLKSSIVPNLAYNKLVISNAILRDFSEVSYGIVKTYGELDSVYEIYLDGLKYSWWIGEDALELYRPSVSEYKVGDKVRIKEKEGCTSDYPLGFTDTMATLSGKIYTIQAITAITCLATAQKKKFFNNDVNKYQLNDGYGGFPWHSSMFELVEEKIDTNKVGDTLTIRCTSGKGTILEFTGEIIPGFTGVFLYFGTHHEEICKIFYKNVSNFGSLASDYGGKTEFPFPVFKTIDNLVKFVTKVNEQTNNQTNNSKDKHHEIRLQKSKTSIHRGTVPEGHRVCGKGCKATIVVGHLSYRESYC